MMKKITAFLLNSGQSDLQETICELEDTNLVDRIVLVGKSAYEPQTFGWIEGDTFKSTKVIKQIIEHTSIPFALIYDSTLKLKLGANGLHRMVQVAEYSKAGLAYADYYEEKEGEETAHPTIEYQQGSLRDDFNFGPLLLFSKEAVDKVHLKEDYQHAGLYDLRLKVSQKHDIVHLPEFTYTTVATDLRTSGEKIFDYVDPKNREVQIEMEKSCTNHLKAINAYIKGPGKEVTFSKKEFAHKASVIIPVRDRVKTIKDAIGSVLSQECNFPFNLIIVDNYSTDGTSKIIEEYAQADSRIVHIIPSNKRLGIGGCWNEAVQSTYCGEFAIQLDSDDLYIDNQTIQRIVDKFEEDKCAMLVGSYQMVNGKLEPIPPGLIDHKEWTDENGANNALRINGLGAPRAFYTPILRDVLIPNTSYGEDYGVGITLAREYKIGRIYDALYLCRRWEENSDSSLDIEKTNKHNHYKDKLRTIELNARIGKA